MAKLRDQTEQGSSHLRTIDRGIQKKRAGPRRSARLRRTRSLEGKRDISVASSPTDKKCPQATQVSPRKRKRQDESENELRDEPYPTPAGQKRARALVEPASGVLATRTTNKADAIAYWTRKKYIWPKDCFKQDDQVREDFNKTLRKEEYWLSNMSGPIPRKKSSSSLRRAQSDAGTTIPTSVTPSDQKPREVKSAPYRDMRYEADLAARGSFMIKYREGVTEDSKNLCRALLESKQTVPQDSLFRDDLFEETCEMIRNKNETRVIRDISLLIVPSAEILAIRGSQHLRTLIETVNEGWNNSRPFFGTRPQPDYSVGFRREAFTQDQLKRLGGLVGNVTAGDMSFYMATYFMYLPFFACEVKCGASALDIADRQNAHSMTLAVRGVVELFKRRDEIKDQDRVKELDREILAFSVSHDHRSVRIYGHYPVIDGDKVTYYRHPIHEFSFTALDGKDKWTAYKFTKNVYDTWVPNHFKRLCSVIDELPPDYNWDVPPLSEGTGLSQDFHDHSLAQSNADSTSFQGDSQGSASGAHDTTPETSVSQPPVFKKPRKRPVAE